MSSVCTHFANSIDDTEPRYDRVHRSILNDWKKKKRSTEYGTRVMWQARGWDKKTHVYSSLNASAHPLAEFVAKYFGAMPKQHKRPVVRRYVCGVMVIYTPLVVEKKKIKKKFYKKKYIYKTIFILFTYLISSGLMQRKLDTMYTIYLYYVNSKHS